MYMEKDIYICINVCIHMDFFSKLAYLTVSGKFVIYYKYWRTCICICIHIETYVFTYKFVYLSTQKFIFDYLCRSIIWRNVCVRIRRYIYIWAHFQVSFLFLSLLIYRQTTCCHTKAFHIRIWRIHMYFHIWIYTEIHAHIYIV